MVKNKPTKTKQKKAKPKKVTTFVEFTVASEKIKKSTQGSDFLYRGHANHHWKLESSAYRRLIRNRTDKDITTAELLDYLEELLDGIRMRGLIKKYGKELAKLEKLAQLQHKRKETCLIDFTKNIHIALWFACQSNKENKEEDGQVIIMPTADPDKLSEFPLEIPLEKDISFFLKGDTLWQWCCKSDVNRAKVQHSVFVFGKNSIDTDLYKTINIAKDTKHAILDDLQTFCGIDEERLFDFS